MTPLAITAGSLLTAAGHGRAANLDALRDERTGLRPCDFAGITTGHAGRIDAVDGHRLPAEHSAYDCRNNRLADMALRLDGFAEAVGDARGRLGARRIATIVGTSTSGVLSCEDAYAARDPDGRLPDAFDYRHTQDLFSLAGFTRAALGLAGPAFTVSLACASSARAFIDAAHLIVAGVVDAAVVGGADSLCRLTLRGFTSLELISPTPCAPCDANRAGISIGEAAGFVLLERAPPRYDGMALLGAGASGDAYHMTSPLPGGEGAALAMHRALASAALAPDRIDAINLHATGTMANDAAEDAAVWSVFADSVACAGTKGWTGHCMGSCGIVEALLAMQCIGAGLLPGCLGASTIDPAFRMRVQARTQPRDLRRVMSNSFGFGGANVSLILGYV